MHHELPPASRPELEHLEGAGESVWAPPTCPELWPSKCPEDRLGLIREHSMAAKGGARSHDSPSLLTAIARRRPRTHPLPSLDIRPRRTLPCAGAQHLERSAALEPEVSCTAARGVRLPPQTAASIRQTT